MSDLGTIGVGIEFNGQTLLRDIERGIEAVERSAKSASTSFAAFERAGLKVAGSFTYMGEQTKSWLRDQKRILDLMNESEKIAQRQAKAEAEVTKEILRQRDAAEQAAATRARNVQSSIGGNLGLGAQGISASASADAFAAQIENLRNKYDKVYVASNLYEQQLKEITLAHNLGVISADRYQNELDTLNMEYQQYANAAEGASLAGNRFSQHVNETSRGLNKFGFVAQQFGYQVGDFFVQIQSGTSIFVAFGQQATQLAGLIPGIGGAIAGIGISVATAFLSAYSRTSEANEAAKAYQQTLQDIDKAIADLNLKSVSVGQKEDSVRKEIISQISEIEAQIFVTKQRQQEEDGIAAQYMNKELATLAAQEKVLRQKLVAYEEEKQKLADAEKRHETAKNLSSQLLQNLQSITKLDIKTPFESALGPLQKLVDKAKEYADAYNKYGLYVISGTTTPIGKYKEGEMDSVARGQLANRPNPFGTPATGAGGAANSSQLAGGLGASGGTDKVQALVESLQTEKEITDQWYADSLTTLQSASDQELAIIGGRNEAKLRLQEEYQARLAEIQEQGNAFNLQTTLEGAASIFGAMGSFNKKFLKAQTVFSAAAALISTYQGAAKELEKGALGFGTAAAVIAKGLGFVAAIRSAGGSGGGGSVGGGGAGSASVPTTSAAPAPQTVYINSLQPDAMYSGQALINLFDAFYDENDKRGKVFVVAR